MVDDPDDLLLRRYALAPQQVEYLHGDKVKPVQIPARQILMKLIWYAEGPYVNMVRHLQ